MDVLQIVNKPEVFHGVVEVVCLDRLQVGGLLHEVDVVRSAIVDPDKGHFYVESNLTRTESFYRTIQNHRSLLVLLPNL